MPRRRNISECRASVSFDKNTCHALPKSAQANLYSTVFLRWNSPERSSNAYLVRGWVSALRGRRQRWRALWRRLSVWSIGASYLRITALNANHSSAGVGAGTLFGYPETCGPSPVEATL